jgi:hypothetical protein
MTGGGGGKISLDNASSVLVASRKRRRRRPMYEIEYKGIKVRSDTLEGARELLRQIQGLPESPDSKPWTEVELRELMGRLKPTPKDLLYRLLINSETSCTDAQLRAMLGLANNKMLAGVLSGISKTALAMRIPPERVYRQSTTYHEGKPIRHYSVSLVFKEAMKKYRIYLDR